LTATGYGDPAGENTKGPEARWSAKAGRNFCTNIYPPILLGETPGALQYGGIMMNEKTTMSLRSKLVLTLVRFGLAATLMSAAAYSQVGAGGNTCVFVFGTINGQSVTVPGLMILAPPTNVVLGPTRVHVDPVTQNVLGFTLTTPGADQTVDGTSLLVPGVDVTVPSFAATINDLNVSNKTCVNFGVTTPAVPIEVPASALQVPGALIDTPEITINALGTQKTVAGQVLTINCQVVVIPGITEVAPSITAGTPDKAIAVDLLNVAAAARFLEIDHTNGGFQVVVPGPAFDPPVLPGGCSVK
jgi:hypothetical protein